MAKWATRFPVHSDPLSCHMLGPVGPTSSFSRVLGRSPNPRASILKLSGLHSYLSAPLALVLPSVSCLLRLEVASENCCVCLQSASSWPFAAGTLRLKLDGKVAFSFSWLGYTDTFCLVPPTGKSAANCSLDGACSRRSRLLSYCRKLASGFRAAEIGRSLCLGRLLDPKSCCWSHCRDSFAVGTQTQC